MADLKPCPFCGGGFRVNSRGAYEHDNENCLLHGIELKNAKDVEEWNTRKPMEAVVAELEKEKAIHTEHFHISLYKDYPEIKQMYEKVCLVIDKAISIVRGKE